MSSPQSNENKLVVPAIISNALERQPNQQNPLQPTQYRFVSWKVPETVYFCQSVTLPGLSIGTTTIDTPLGIGLPQPGTRYEFDEFEMSFIVNEDMSNWRELDTWIRGFGPMHESAYNADTALVESDKVPLLSDSERYNDGALIITTSANTPSLIVEFSRMFPTRLSSITFDSSLGEPEAVVASVSFAYSHYTIRDYS